MKYIFFNFISFFCILNFSRNVDAEFANEKVSNCDYDRFESELDALKSGNLFIMNVAKSLQLQLEEQKTLFQGLENKINDISQNLQVKENNMNKHFDAMKNLIDEQNQMNKKKNENESPGSDKWQIMNEIKEKINGHNILLNNFDERLKNMENLLPKANCETQSQMLAEGISKNLNILQNMNEKLSSIGIKITSQFYPTSCSEFKENYCANNKCYIYNLIYGPKPFLVSCNDSVEGGGWTVIQRRINGSVDFYRGWTEYKNGFGNIDGEFFIGLDKLYVLTNTLQRVELMIQLQDFNNALKYAKYDEFVVGNESENYKLMKVGSYSGDAGDSFSQHSGQQFSTKGRDNDVYSGGNCAELRKGAWWFRNCNWSNLNGKYYDNGKAPDRDGINWGDFHGYNYSLKSVQMMIRPIKRNV